MKSCQRHRLDSLPKSLIGVVCHVQAKRGAVLSRAGHVFPRHCLDLLQRSDNMRLAVLLRLISSSPIRNHTYTLTAAGLF